MRHEKHTPGPWRVVNKPHETRNERRIGIRSSANAWIASVGNMATAHAAPGSRLLDEQEANARLIAAAPALLAALREIVDTEDDQLISGIEYVGRIGGALKAARSALAAAEGRE